MSKRNEAEQAARDEAAENYFIMGYELKPDKYLPMAYKAGWSASTAYHAPQLAAVEGLWEALKCYAGQASNKQTGPTFYSEADEADEALNQYKATMAKGEDTK